MRMKAGMAGILAGLVAACLPSSVFAGWCSSGSNSTYRSTYVLCANSADHSPSRPGEEAGDNPLYKLTCHSCGGRGYGGYSGYGYSSGYGYYPSSSYYAGYSSGYGYYPTSSYYAGYSSGYGYYPGYDSCSSCYSPCGYSPTSVFSYYYGW